MWGVCVCLFAEMLANRLLTDKIATGENLYDWTPEKSADYEDRKRKPFYRFATVTIDEE